MNDHVIAARSNMDSHIMTGAKTFIVLVMRSPQQPLALHLRLKVLLRYLGRLLPVVGGLRDGLGAGLWYLDKMQGFAGINLAFSLLSLNYVVCQYLRS